MFFCFGSRCLHFIGVFFTKRDSFNVLRTIDLHCRRPDSLADWGLKRLPKKQRFSSRPTLICPIAVRRRSNIPSARQTNTATSIRLWLRLNTPANLGDTATYSTPHSPCCRHIHPPPSATVPPAKPARGMLLADGHLRWMEYLTFRFLIWTISADVFLLKPLMEIDLSQRHSSAAEAEAYRRLEVLFCQRFLLPPVS